MSNIKSSILYSAVTSLFICTLFLGFNYLEAQWSVAPGNPPNGNIDAPIHTGGGVQYKNTGTGEAQPLSGDRLFTGQFIATDRMRSDQYCDVNGNNCFSPGTAGAACPPRTFSLPATGDIYGTCDYNLPPGFAAQMILNRDTDNYINGTHPRSFQCQEGQWEMIDGANTCNWDYSGLY